MKADIFKIFIFFICCTFNLLGQSKKAEDYGFRHLQLCYQTDSVSILIKSKEGEENKPKPLFLFCQGSLPQPLIKYDEQGVYGVFPFNPDSLIMDYHLVIVSKPFIPLIAERKSLRGDFSYVDAAGKFPIKYSERNWLDYYVNRNKEVIEFLQKQKWVLKNRLVVAGHSEGSTIAAKLALACSRVTHLIYSGGNPCGRIVSMIEEGRSVETEQAPYGEEFFNYWADVVDHPVNMNDIDGDTYKATYSFSYPPKDYLEKLTIPVLICYGTKDRSAPFNDYFRTDMIRKKKSNFNFKTYIGTEHNYFPLLPSGQIDYERCNWDNVAIDWYRWLR